MSESVEMTEIFSTCSKIIYTQHRSITKNSIHNGKSRILFVYTAELSTPYAPICFDYTPRIVRVLFDNLQSFFCFTMDNRTLYGISYSIYDCLFLLEKIDNLLINKKKKENISGQFKMEKTIAYCRLFYNRKCLIFFLK